MRMIQDRNTQPRNLEMGNMIGLQFRGHCSDDVGAGFKHSDHHLVLLPRTAQLYNPCLAAALVTACNCTRVEDHRVRNNTRCVTSYQGSV